MTAIPADAQGERRKTWSTVDRVCLLGRKVNPGQVGYLGRRGHWGWAVLTAQGSAWARTHGGCTACTGRHGKPGWQGSPALTASQPPAGAGSQSSLKQHKPSLCGCVAHGLCWCPVFPTQTAKASVLETKGLLLCQA